MAIVLASSVLVLAAPARASTGSPDSYGYIWVDSKSPSPTFPYNWNDILSRGVRLTLPDDGCTFEVPLGFQFRYYGTIQQEVFVCSNGFVTFGVPDSFYPDPPIPSPAAPNSRLIGLGRDINPADPRSGGVYVHSSTAGIPKRFTVTWNAIYTIGATQQPQTFQIILEQNETTKDGRVIMQYKTLNGIGSPLVGIENATGSSGLAYPGPLANNLAVAFLPPTDQGLPPDTLRVTGVSIAPNRVQQGAFNVGMLRMDLSTTTNELTVSMIRVDLTGLRAGPEDVPRARLWLDANNDGVFQPGGGDVSIVAADMQGVPPHANFLFSPLLRVAVGSPQRLFVSYDFSAFAGINDLVGASLRDTGSFAVSYPDLVGTTGLPFDTYVPNTRTWIDASQDTLLLGSLVAYMPAEVAQWETDVPAFGFTLDADRNYVTLSGIIVWLGGNAVASDIWSVKVLRDVDADGNYTPGTDPVLAFGTPAGSPPRVTLTFARTIAAGSPERFLVLADIAPAAVVGRTINLRTGSSDMLLGPGVDAVSPANFPATSGPANLTAGTRPTLTLPWVTVEPTADRVWQDQEYLLGPSHTVSLLRPAGNEVPGFLTASNNLTNLFLAVDVPFDVSADPGDGLAFAFDTDGNGAPTVGGDDRFVLNASGAARLQYTGAAWTVVAACVPYAGNPSNASCAVGFGATAFRTIPHRFYEISVPLAAFGVGQPIPAGTRIRFAVGAPPHVGLADGGNQSTWPLLFGPGAAVLPDFGDLLLATGFVPNRSPSLAWTGEPGYTADAVEPDMGPANATYMWRITYIDEDNDPPALYEPQLHVFHDGLALVTSPYAMAPVNPKGGNYRLGVIFFTIVPDLVCGGLYQYFITVRDARGRANNTQLAPGPQVVCPDYPPTLWQPSVNPLAAEAGAQFSYRVQYTDPEGRPPVSLRGFIQRGGLDYLDFTPAFLAWVNPVQPDYMTGALYEASVLLSPAGYNYTYRFEASDGNSTVFTDWIFGPYVLVPPPHVLAVSSVDLAPLVVNQGARAVLLQWLYFSTASPGGVNITRIQVDRIGTSTDADVDSVQLYNDVNATGSMAGAVFVAANTFLGGRVSFPVTLRATPSRPAAVLLLVNVSRSAGPDNTIGLEVRDASYLSVGPGDVVQAFPPYRSTAALVNAPPNPNGLTVNGFTDGTAGIAHILGASPTLAWRFRDPNAADLTQIQVNVTVSSVSPARLVFWHNESTGTTSLPYAGEPLVHGTSYVFQVVAFDGRLWSSPVGVLFRMNTPPPAPTPFAPADLARDVTRSPTLVWNPVADAESDPILYWYWVSEDVGFANPVVGTTISPGASFSLAEGTTYYWKVAASDGYEVTGNTTVWQFTTVTSVPPVRGEVRGRVMNGTAPLAEAFVELLLNGTPLRGAFTAANGTFRFLDLDLQPYTVRVSAIGFRIMTRAAAPTQSFPLVDLLDISLERVVTGGGGNPSSSLPFWAVLLIVALLVTTGATSVLAAFLGRRRRKRQREEDAEAVADVEATPTSGSKAPAPAARSVSRSDGPVAVAAAARPAAPSGAGRSVSTASLKFECPDCGRAVTADATRCVCGAEFESSDASGFVAKT